MNTTTKPVTLATLAASLPPNPFNRLDIYQVDETNKLSSTIRLVVAAARAMGLKGVLQIFDDRDRRIVRKQLQLSKVEHFNANHVWEEVQQLLKSLSVLYTEDNE